MPLFHFHDCVPEGLCDLQDWISVSNVDQFTGGVHSTCDLRFQTGNGGTSNFARAHADTFFRPALIHTLPGGSVHWLGLSKPRKPPLADPRLVPTWALGRVAPSNTQKKKTQKKTGNQASSGKPITHFLSGKTVLDVGQHLLFVRITVAQPRA